MAQSSRILDNVGRMMNDAAGVADGVRREVESMVSMQWWPEEWFRGRSGGQPYSSPNCD